VKQNPKNCARRTAPAGTRAILGAGKAYYEPETIRCRPAAGGEWDQDTPPYMAQALFPKLVNSALQAARADRRGDDTV